ncbi:ABC transporter permease subunit [Escherichia coli]
MVLLLNKTTFGRNTLAIGGNEEAASGGCTGCSHQNYYLCSGLVSAIAGIILASRMTSGQPMTSIGYELIVISACVLGGVSLKGGIGKNLICGGGYLNFRHRGKRHEPA